MNSNINKESHISLKQFREKQIKSNIILHIIFIILIFIIDAGLLIFIFIYKFKISKIKSKSKENSSLINSNQNLIDESNDSINHKFLNIISQMPTATYRFSYMLEKSEHVQKLKNSIKVFYKDIKDINLDTNKFGIRFIYSGFAEGDSYSYIKDKIDYSYNNFIIIESDDNMKFGFYFEETIDLSNEKGFQYNGNKCFIISFQHDGIFKCIDDKSNKISIKNDENMIVIGNDDIIIKNEFFGYDDKKGIINFPFKSIDVSNINKNIFTEINGKFEVRGIEIFSFDI